MVTHVDHRAQLVSKDLPADGFSKMIKCFVRDRDRRGRRSDIACDYA